MSQPVKLSDALVLDARLAGEVVERSIAGQVEFWAQVGRSVDLLLEGGQVLALRRKGSTQPLSALLDSVDLPAGRERVAAWLQGQPFPHYKPHPDIPCLLERIDEDGSRTVGRFVNRQFIPVGSSLKVSASAREYNPLGSNPLREVRTEIRARTSTKAPAKTAAKAILKATAK
jgi:hypothetical protein